MLIEFESNGASYSTDENIDLVLGPGIIKADASFSLHHRDKSDDLPIDTLSMQVLFPDCDGAKWQTEVKFTTQTLMASMVNFVHGLDTAPRRIDDFMRNFAGEPILTDVRYSNDARTYRTLNIGGELSEIPFKYTGVSMDLFDLHPYTIPFPLLASLSVLISPGLLDVSGDDVGSFGFVVPVVDLLRHNTAYYDEEIDNFVDSDIPAPLQFTRIGHGFEPQKNVRVVQSLR